MRKDSTQPIIDELSDRRLDLRVSINTAIEVEYGLTEKNLHQEDAYATQLSRRGITLIVKNPIPLNSEVIMRIPIPNSGHSVQSTGKISWAAARGNHVIHGVEFVYVPKLHLPFLNQYLRLSLTQKKTILERRFSSRILSELIEFKNEKGQRIVGFHDHLPESKFFPYVVIPSAYGETKINSLQIAYFLAINGFNVIRFDPSNHVGESDGSHLDFNLPQLKEDIVSAIDYIYSIAPLSKIGIVASSLAARASFKVISEDQRVSILISLVGVVNTQETLRIVQNIDLVDGHQQGKKWGIGNIAGFDVNFDNFLEQCVSKSFHNLDTTISDLIKAKCPTVLLCALNDPWVDLKDCTKLIELIPENQREVHYIAGMHRLKENPSEAKKAFKTVVSAAARSLKEEILPISNVLEPSPREIGLQARLERERIKFVSSYTREEESDFWKSYLDRFHYIHSVADYKDLMTVITSELGPISHEDHILDAGCGNGNFGIWLLEELANKISLNMGSNKLVFRYTAVDLISEALKNAQNVINGLQERLRSSLELKRDLMIPSFCKIDLNGPLPFLDGTYEKICSNLVISYLNDPYSFIKELVRVLKPEGKLVLTTLKKDADVSEIYRNFISKARTKDEVDEAKNLLSNAGKILLKESEGHFQFFNQVELLNLAKRAAPNCQTDIQMCFSNQAVALIISK